MLSYVLCIVFMLSLWALADIPTFELKNAAVSGMTIPAVGLGMGAYSTTPAGYGVYPECFNEDTGCGSYAVQSVMTWLEAGGRRLDCSNSYFSDKSVGEALQRSGVPREQIFILDKVGPAFPLGYNDTLKQIDDILQDLNTTYVDLLLVHWPDSDPNIDPIGQSTDPACLPDNPRYDMRQCRLDTWRAMMNIFEGGKAKAIGVSNYEITHLQEIIKAGLILPSYNQCPFHLYRSTSQDQLRQFCKENNILFGGYSPFGVPDYHHYPPPNMSMTPLQDPRVVQIAKAHDVTPAQVLLQWQYALGIPTQPRSQNTQHMKDNLNGYSFTLSEEEIQLLMQAPQDTCSEDPDWYECAPTEMKNKLKRWAKWLGLI